MFTHNGQRLNCYILNFYRNIGCRLDNTYTYVVTGTSKRNAIMKFLLQDRSNSPFSIEFSHQDVNPNLFNNPNITLLNQKMEESGIDNIDAEEDDRQAKLYQTFIINNIELIIKVLILLDTEKFDKIFSIKKTHIIS